MFHCISNVSFIYSSWLKIAVSQNVQNTWDKEKSQFDRNPVDVCCLLIMRKAFAIGEKWLPKNVHDQIPRICDCVIFYGKRDLASCD